MVTVNIEQENKEKLFQGEGHEFVLTDETFKFIY